MYWTWCSVVWNIPVAHFRSAVLAMVPPIFLCTCSLAKHGKPKSPSERVNTTQQQWKQCGIIILILNSQCSTVSVTRNSSNFIPSESGMISIPYFLYLLCHTQVLFFAVTSYSDTVTFPVFWYIHTHIMQVYHCLWAIPLKWVPLVHDFEFCLL